MKDILKLQLKIVYYTRGDKMNRKWLYFIFCIAILMIIIDVEHKNIKAQDQFNESLISERTLAEGVTEKIYLITSNEASEKIRSVSARRATKKYTYEVNGEECLIIYVYANFSYGHTDGKARITSSSYSISKIDSHIVVNNFSQQNCADTNPRTILSFTLKDKHYTPVLVQTKTIIINCKNNGDYY